MEDKILWSILALTGLNVGMFKHGILKTLAQISAIMFQLGAIHFLCIGIYSNIYLFYEVKINFAYMFSTLLSFSLWYTLFFKRRSILYLLIQVKKYRNVLGITPNGKRLWINVLLIIISALLFIITSIRAFRSGDIEFETVWTYGYKAEDNVINHIIIFVGSFYCHVLLFYMPSLTTLIFCTIQYRCAEMLTFFNEKLKKSLTQQNSPETIYLIQIYFNITDILNMLNDSLSIPLFVLVLGNCFRFFSVMTLWYLKRNLIFSEVTEFVGNFIAAGVAILALAVCGAQNPEKMRDIKITTEKYINTYGGHYYTRPKILFHMKRIEKKEIIYVTACGVITFERRLALSLFGCMFTYGLLVINIQ